MDAIYHSLFLKIIVCLASGVSSSSLFSPCKANDFTCMENTVNAALPKILDGVPELGIGSSDPIFIEFMNGSVPTLKSLLYNTTHTGYKRCTIFNLKFNDDMTTLNCEANCKGFTLNGQYEIEGNIVTMPMEGKGDYKIVTGEFLTPVDVNMEKVKRGDGKTHLVIKDVKVNPKPLTVSTYHFDNLFDGKKDLADAVHKFVQDNWLLVTEFAQRPVWTATLKEVIANVNKYLEHIPLEDIWLS